DKSSQKAFWKAQYIAPPAYSPSFSCFPSRFCGPDIRAFYGKVDAGFPQKMRPNPKTAAANAQTCRRGHQRHS
ncbi:MAG: hypothetical protein WB624_05685, partial [Xanthobacteraceae bacterium]